MPASRDKLDKIPRRNHHQSHIVQKGPASAGPFFVPLAERNMAKKKTNPRESQSVELSGMDPARRQLVEHLAILIVRSLQCDQSRADRVESEDGKNVEAAAKQHPQNGSNPACTDNSVSD